MAPNPKPAMPDRRTLLSRQRAYIRLHTRIDRLEDAMSHLYKITKELRNLYNVTNELRERVSTLEKESKPLAKDD